MKIVLVIAAMLLVVSSCAPAAADVPTAALTVPGVQIDSPTNGHAVLIGQTLEVHVTGVDAQAGVSRLELRVADGVVDSATTAENVPQPVFSAILRWLPTTTGGAVVSVVAYRVDGTASAPVSIAVNVVTPTPTPGPPTPSPTLSPSPSLTPLPTAGPSPSASPTAEPPSPTPDLAPTTPLPTPTPDPTAAPASPTPAATPRVSPVDLMPQGCRSRASLVRLTGDDLDGDGSGDSVVYGNCGADGQGEPTFYGPVVRLSADDSVAGPRNGAILTGYGTPSDVIVVRPGPDGAFVVAHLQGASPGVAQLTVYGLIAAEKTLDSVYELPASATWCSFRPLNNGLGNRVGIVVTEAEPGSYEFEETRCELGTLRSIAYEWRVRDLPAPGQQWPAPAQTAL